MLQAERVAEFVHRFLQQPRVEQILILDPAVEFLAQARERDDGAFLARLCEAKDEIQAGRVQILIHERQCPNITWR